MSSSFNNMNPGFGRLSTYLAQTRQLLSRVAGIGSRAIGQQDSDLFRQHADMEPGRIMRLLSEMQRVGGEITEEEFLLKNNMIKPEPSEPQRSDNDALFQLSQKQIWSNFAREITKSLKRNL